MAVKYSNNSSDNSLNLINSLRSVRSRVASDRKRRLQSLPSAVTAPRMTYNSGQASYIASKNYS